MMARSHVIPQRPNRAFWRPWSVSHETIRIAKEGGVVEIHPLLGGDAFDIRLVPDNPNLYIPRKSCRSTLPLDLIQDWLSKSGFASFCETLGRHEDAIPKVLKQHLFAYFAPEDFAGKRLLDFGCGSGASTLAMSKLLPQTEIIGVELSAERVKLANRIRSHRRLSNAQFQCSPAPDRLPPGIGEFDFIMLSAVYEHLLPNERQIVSPLLWSAMKVGGVIFINQTPYRYSPLEAHSTGLWFINYMPDRAAHWTVRHFAKRGLEINRSADWNVHLRGGLRGATEREIVRNLTRSETRYSPRILQPRQNGLRDRADFWLSCTNPQRYRLLKRSIAAFFRFTDKTFRTIPGLNLELVVQKVQP